MICFDATLKQSDMKKIISILLITVLSISTSYSNENKKKMNIYQFKTKTLQGKEISLNEYKGKVILIVNTASKCGFTPQYEGLETLYKNYKDKGLVILGFPCNQFGNQEPGNEDDISNFCSINYGVTFPMFMKIDVNGKNADPIYKYLKESLPGTFGDSIKWNFTKFLINKQGIPVERYAPTTKPASLENDIKKLLAE